MNRGREEERKRDDEGEGEKRRKEKEKLKRGKESDQETTINKADLALPRQTSNKTNTLKRR